MTPRGERARAREQVRAAVNKARHTIGLEPMSPGAVDAIDALADAVELLVDVSEAQDKETA